MSKARELRIQSIVAREPFGGRNDNMTGVIVGTWDTGRMPPEHARTYKEHRDADEIAYTILSYSTPILWVTTDGTVHMPECREAFNLPKPVRSRKR